MTNSVITTKLKDNILSLLIENCKLEKGSTFDSKSLSYIYNTYQIDYDSFSALLKYFERLQFISKLDIKRIGIMFVLHIEALDFFNTGGFEMNDTILLKNTELLLAEIEALKPAFGDKFEKITTIAASIATYLTFLKS